MQTATHTELTISAAPAARAAAAAAAKLVRTSRYDRSAIMRDAYEILRFEAAKYARLVASLAAMGRTVTKAAPTLGAAMVWAWEKARRLVAYAAANIAAEAFAAARTPAENAAQDARICEGVAAFRGE